MRVSRRSLLSRLFEEGDWLEDWDRPAGAHLDEDPEGLIANMSQEEATRAHDRARDAGPWIDPGIGRGGRGDRRSAAARRYARRAHGRR